MTIRDLRYDFVPDISANNDILSLAVSPSLKLAAGVWTLEVKDSLATAQLKCLDHSLKSLQANMPDWQFCLLAGHKTVQPNNRITRYRGLWKSLAAGGAVLPEGEFGSESVVVQEGGMRVFGAVRFALSQLKAVYCIMLMTQSAIAFARTSATVTKVPQLTDQGWAAPNTKPPEEIVEVICDRSGLVIDTYGEFDDRTVSVAAIGQKEVLIGLKP